MSFTIYKYNQDFIYTQQEESNVYLPIEKTPQVGANETLKAIPAEIPEGQSLQFNPIEETWNFVFVGNYYDIKNGNLMQVIPASDISKFTLITPPVLKAEDVIFFKDKQWIYKATSAESLKDNILDLQGQIDSSYSNSKSKCKLTLNNVLAYDESSIDNTISSLSEFLSSQQDTLTLPNGILTSQQALEIQRYLVNLRTSIKNNVINVKIEIGNLTKIKDINKFSTNLQIKFPSEIQIESILAIE